MYKIESKTFLMYFLAVFMYMAMEVLTVFQIETEF